LRSGYAAPRWLGRYTTDLLESSASPGSNLESIELQLPPHSVKVLKIIDSSTAATAPTVTVRVPEKAETGAPIQFSAESDPAGVPVLSYRWDFGDGTHADGAAETHAYTYAGDFTVHIAAKGLDGIPFEKSMTVKVEGKIGTRFVPAKKVRLGRPD
jgi:alpha-galactosidase